MKPRWRTLSATIADSASLSGAVTLNDFGDDPSFSLVGIIAASGWTTAVLTFQASNDGTNYYNLYNSAGAEVTTGSIAASSFVAMDPADFVGIRYLKVRSGTSGSATNQSGGDTLTLVLRAV